MTLPATNIRSIAWSSDGKMVAASEGMNGLVKVWDATTGKPLAAISDEEMPLGSVVWSPDSRWLAVFAWNQVVTIWNSMTWQQKYRWPLHADWNHNLTNADGVYSVAFSPDGKQLAAGSTRGWIVVWDMHSGRELSSFHAHSAKVRTVAWHPDGTRLAAASEDGLISIWDTATWEQVLLLDGHETMVFSIAWNPNGRQLVSMSTEDTKLWDLNERSHNK